MVVADEVERLRDDVVEVLADELGMSRADEVERCFQHVGFYSCRALRIAREHKGSACDNESKSSYLSHPTCRIDLNRRWHSSCATDYERRLRLVDQKAKHCKLEFASVLHAASPNLAREKSPRSRLQLDAWKSGGELGGLGHRPSNRRTTNLTKKRAVVGSFALRVLF